MIVCSCNIITKAEIEQVIIDLLDEQQWRLIVPAQVYHRLGKQGKCCRCFPNVSQMIVEITEQYHSGKQTPVGERRTLLNKLSEKHMHYHSVRNSKKGRQFSSPLT